jgi:class 3 adenylate cyclase
MIGIITGILTIVGVVVAVTRYVTQLQAQLKIERLEGEKTKAETARADLAAANNTLLDELAAARRGGAEASARKAEVDKELETLVRMTGASAGSVYIPLPSERSNEPRGLLFLSILPITEETAKLRKKLIPMQSLAGRCFTSATPSVESNAKSATGHFDQADDVSGYRTEDTLSYPLTVGGNAVGVIQLLNRTGGQRFTEADITSLSRLTDRISKKVDDFRLATGSFDLLGAVPEMPGESATVMFCDLTASSRLFEELTLGDAVRHLNEYFEQVCSVVFRNGGTIDKYSGDGVLFRFNVPKPVIGHEDAAVRAAVEVQSAFAELKRQWLKMGDNLSVIHSRVGLAAGPVQQAIVGHPQSQYLTLFGTAVNAAVNLCDSAPRDRSVVVIDQAIRDAVGTSRSVRPLPAENLGKAGKYTKAAYEVV